jgi:cytochrome c551
MKRKGEGMQIKFIFVVAVLCFGVSIDTGCGSKESVVQVDAAGRFSDAVQVYQNNCISCHGADLQGGVGPALKNVGSRLSSAQIQHQIYTGGGPMPGYGHNQQGILSDQQIQELTNWLSTKK